LINEKNEKERIRGSPFTCGFVAHANPKNNELLGP